MDTTSTPRTTPHGHGGIPARLVWLVLGVALYAAAVYWSSRSPSWITLALALLPLAWVAGVLAWRATDRGLKASTRLLSTLPLLVLLGVLANFSGQLIANVRWLYLIQHVGIHAALAWVFGRSLLAGRTPLCTEMASWVHEDITQPRLRWYTRQVTWVWTLFFGLMAMASLLLYALASPQTWTLFSTGVTAGLTGALFVLENLARSAFLPPQDRVGLVGTWRAVCARLAEQQQNGPADQQR